MGAVEKKNLGNTAWILMIMDNSTTVEECHDVVLDLEVGCLKLCDAVEVFEKCYLARILALNHGQKGKTAKMLGINRKTLYTKLKKYDML
jgi:DNA-binding NtrC family response regulator